MNELYKNNINGNNQNNTPEKYYNNTENIIKVTESNSLQLQYPYSVTNIITFPLKKNSSKKLKFLFIDIKKYLLMKIILMLLLPISIIAELFYRYPLMDLTITFEEKLQNSLSENSINLFKVISKLGGGLIIAITFIIFSLFTSVIELFFIICTLVFSVYLHSLMKGLYREKRPFWENQNLFQKECQLGYGNPSGHSLTQIFFFLTLCDLIIKKIKINFIKKLKKVIMTFIIFLIILFSVGWPLLVSFSRLVDGVHYINQIVYGLSLGIVLFFLFSLVLELYEIPLQFFIKIFKIKKIIGFVYLTLIFLFAISFISFLILDPRINMKKYNDMVENLCPDKAEFKKLLKESFNESLKIFIIFGLYTGQCIYWHLVLKTKNYNINNLQHMKRINKVYNEKNISFIKKIFESWKTFYKILLIFIITLMPGILYIAIPIKNTNIIIIFIFQEAAPFFLISCIGAGPCLFYFRKILFDKDNDNYIVDISISKI